VNARAETVASKPSFRSAFAARRCILPADGFYEWQVTEDVAGRRTKNPYYARAPGGDLLALAAVWEEPNGPVGAPLGSCAVITAPANAALAQVHDRMPVLLPSASWARWLAPEPLDEASHRELLRPAPDGLLVVEQVSTEVNNPRADGPSLIRAAGT
jgi:putative SOS response-associated peptidase YedK